MAPRPRNTTVPTERQLGVAKLYAFGWTYDEIGRSLNISPETAKKHVEAALGRIPVPDGASRRAALRAYFGIVAA